MSRVGPPRTHRLLARLARAADLRGDADGVATRAELRAIAALAERGTAVGGRDPSRPVEARRVALARALGAAEGALLATLEPALTRLPEPLRRLALEVDGLWGDADGAVTVAELDRVARYYLAALPFFASEAKALLALAEHLGYAAGDPEAPAAKGVVGLRVALGQVDRDSVARGREFRALFDEAVREGEVAGVPELLREAAAHSPRWHRLSVLEHTAVAIDAIAGLADAVGVRWQGAAAVMLLHDVGKLLGRKLVPGEGRYSFWGHEAAGAEWLRARGIDPDIAFHVEHHSDLRRLAVDEVFEGLCGGDAGRLREVLLVYVADQIAKGDTPDQLRSFAEQEPKLRELCAIAGLDADALLSARDALLARWFGAHAARGP